MMSECVHRFIHSKHLADSGLVCHWLNVATAGHWANAMVDSHEHLGAARSAGSHTVESESTFSWSVKRLHHDEYSCMIEYVCMIIC
jgi:hypothetical protein